MITNELVFLFLKHLVLRDEGLTLREPGDNLRENSMWANTKLNYLPPLYWQGGPLIYLHSFWYEQKQLLTLLQWLLLVVKHRGPSANNFCICELESHQVCSWLFEWVEIMWSGYDKEMVLLILLCVHISRHCCRKEQWNLQEHAYPWPQAYNLMSYAGNLCLIQAINMAKCIVI